MLSVIFFTTLFSCKKDGELYPEFNSENLVVRFTDTLSISTKVLRNDSLIFLNIIPNNYFDTKSKKNIGRIGIKASSSILKKLSVLQAIELGFYDSIQMTFEWLRGLKSLISIEVDKKDILGPIGIAKISGSSLDAGLFSVLFLMAVLSINLGLINLLPIPALDGGYLALFIYEFFFNKPYSSLRLYN